MLEIIQYRLNEVGSEHNDAIDTLTCSRAYIVDQKPPGTQRDSWMPLSNLLFKYLKIYIFDDVAFFMK